MRARALAVLCGLAVRQSRTEKVTVEILEVEELGVIRAGGELVAA